MSYQIHADHGGGRVSIETGERYISAFEGHCGDGWVLSIDRTTHHGTLMSNDIPNPVPVSADDPVGPIILDQCEKIWIISCWMSILRESFNQVERRILTAAAGRMPAHVTREILHG